MPFGHFFTTKKKRIYLDFAAATPVRKEVMEAMSPFFSDVYGNPSAIHNEGVEARRAVEDARSTIAKSLHVRSEEVYFTGSGTESNNLAIYGRLRALIEDDGKQWGDVDIISTKIEHPSILHVLEHLTGHGVSVKYVDVDSDGLIVEKHLQSLLSERTALVTFAYANSEVGVIQDVKRIARLIRKHNTETGSKTVVHLDAAQAPLWLPCQLDMLGVDILSLDAGKCYGPKGVGVLIVRRTTSLKGFVLGGGQEGGLRAGTENTPLIVGAAKAIEIAQETYETRANRARKLRDACIEQLEKKINGVVLNGSSEERLSNNINISLPGIDTEYAVVTLDTNGIACSTKSACSGASGNGSGVVRVITNDEERAKSTIRLSLGEETTMRDIEKTVNVLAEHVTKMREFAKTLT